MSLGSKLVADHPPAWQKLPIAIRLASLMAFLAILPLLVFGFFSRMALEKQVVNNAYALNLQRAEITRHILDARLTDAQSDIELIASDSLVTRFLSTSGEPERLVALLQKYCRYHQLNALYAADRTGKVLVAQDARLVGRSLESEPYFQKAAAGGILIDNPRYDPGDGQVFIHIAAPIVEQDGQIIGVMVGRLAMENLDELIAADNNYSGHGEFGILWDEQGIILSHGLTSRLRFQPVDMLSITTYAALAASQPYGPNTAQLMQSTPLYPEILQHEPSASPYVHMTQGARDEVYASLAPLTQAHWTYGVFIPRTGVNSSIQNMSGDIVTFSWVIIAASLLFNMAAALWVARPLQKMATTARAIAAGDTKQRVALKRGDEIGQLAEAFDHMADVLAEKEAQQLQNADQLEKIVQARTASLREALREKNTLLREINHRVKNNMQAIIGLVDLRLTHVSDPASRQALREFQHQARAISLVYEQLMTTQAMSRVNMKQYIENLAAHVIQNNEHPQAVELVMDIVPLELDVAQAMPCGQIINELVSNAQKHAFQTPDGRAPSITITLRQSDQLCTLVVSDNGAGLPADFSLQADKTIGMRLVNMWATHQLGGTLETQVNQGTRFTIRFPIVFGDLDTSPHKIA